MPYHDTPAVKGALSMRCLLARTAWLLLLAATGCERYEQKDGAVYYRESSGSMQTTPVLIPQADPDTFRALSHKYARDGHHVYYRGKVVQGAQPGYIKVLAHAYARDRRSAYCAGQTIPGADPRSFRVMNAAYAADAKRVYWCTTALHGADVPSFRLLQHGGGALDSGSVFRGPDRVDVCRRATFREIDGEWQTDGLCVYRFLKRQPMIDAASFEVLGKKYVRDRLRVYVIDTIEGVVVVPGADPATFREIEAGRYGDVYGQDGAGCYAGQRRLACSTLLAQP